MDATRKRKFCVYDDENGDESEDKVYRFQVLLPNGITVQIIRRNPKYNVMSLETFVDKVKEKCNEILRQNNGSFKNSKRRVFWESKELYLEDDKGCKIRGQLCFDKFKANRTHRLKLIDGAGHTVDSFENMWDLTPDTSLLTELPDDYTFETALADLIDNSLQAVWSNDKNERKLICVDINEDGVSVFDTGPGMDGSDENSIVNWGKMGASIHRNSKELAIGGKPPYLTPFFGMFGYGGTIASMHLGRHAVVSAKTKESKKVYWLHLERDALLKQSGTDLKWKVPGGIRDPDDSEIEMSPHGSFTEIVLEPKLKVPDVYQLQCKLKDIYFPYIQCDEMSKKGRTTTLVNFQVNGINLATIAGGEVAMTNLHSCNGPDFVLNLHFSTEENKKSPGVKTVCEGNARLKCVYFPMIEGKENIEKILQNLNSDGCGVNEDFETFSRISIRRLGRLLPEARWDLLPFMKLKPYKRGANIQTLKRCCSRVKCFIDTDGGFNPIPSKTDLAPHHPFTRALKDLGGDTHQREKVVKVQILRDGKQLTTQQLEKEYQDWILQMHGEYDDEYRCDDGNESVVLVNAPNKEALCITADVVRVHEAINRKGKSWNRGQKVKILKGACTGCHKNNMFATLEYFLLEGLKGDSGGDARVICRPLGVEDECGSILTVDASNSPNLELRNSISLPIAVIESGKCLTVSDDEWNTQLNKWSLKVPSTIQVLGPKHCKALNIDRALPTDASVSAGYIPPQELVAILRPSNFSPSSTSNDLDQKYILRDSYEMSLGIKYKSEAGKGSNMEQIFSGTATSTTRGRFQGLYIFSLESIQSLFQKAGVYTFSFALKNSSTASCEKVVTVKALSKIKRWELSKDDQNVSFTVSVGSSFPPFSVARYDEYDNLIPFRSTPIIEFRLMSNAIVLSYLKNVKVELSQDLSHIIVSNVRITTDSLDNIRPNYKASLTLSERDGLPFIKVPCQVFPGPIRSVDFYPSEPGKPLLPMQVLEDIKLELFDKHHNHAKQGTEVELKVNGFNFLDQIGLKRKVDEHGFINLSGLLKVTEGYGKPVVLSVISNKTVIGTKKFQVEKRELRVATMVPERWHPGSKIKDIVFEVVNSKGNVDHTINDSINHGNAHTLKITTDFSTDDDSLRYAFKQGRCVIPSITLPKIEGSFYIEAIHCQHQELRVKLKVSTSTLQTSKEYHLDERSAPLSVHSSATCDLTRKGSQLFDMSEATVALSQESNNSSPVPTVNLEHWDHSLDKDSILSSEKVSTWAKSKSQKKQDVRTPNKQSDPNYRLNHDLYNSPEGMNASADTRTPEHAIPLTGPASLEGIKSLEEDIRQCGTYIKDQEETLKWFMLRKMELEDDLTLLQDSMEPPNVSQSDNMSQKEVLDRIEKVESAASILGNVSKNASLKARHPEFMADVVGVVALIATASTSSLSCSLAQYLGEDQMLAIVCKSNVAITTPEKYEEVLYSLAGELGKSVTRRQLIICLEDLRAYDGDIQTDDVQRRLALPKPTLHNGTTPSGFLGYAVNLIDIDVDYVQTKTVAGHGLRETLFYRLFGELQVYQTKEDMKHARECITDGAVSLDGGIIRGNGIISLGSEEVSVHFPIIEKDRALVILSDTERNNTKVIDDIKDELRAVELGIEQINQKISSHKKFFHKKAADFLKIVDDAEVALKLHLSQQSSKNTPMAPS